MTRANRKMLIAVAGVVALAGCTDPRFQPGGELERTRQGALTGALIGGLIGGIEESGNDRVRGAAVGAAIGAAGGAVVGNILDKQAQELNRDLGNNIDVINTGDELIVRMPQDILFAFDSDRVRPDLRADLFTLADSLQRYPDTTVQIIGHTDNVGSASYNQNLSERRASSVGSVLVNAGVPGSRLRIFGAGEDQPIASNLTEEGRAQNRRVDIVIRPNR
ncbi:MAG: OmpA family protein [Rhodobacteraceae bacterium]|nr:OmpA family protein [Alphaproteobacteria bacterium]MBT8473961.1 OmpA family protein [Alphaproteobacteria bacterium]NNF72359.1 OmpA family protein [Paracoccaceae bacterium]NNK66149.1 OmpA family protein [Paracoccaceae bacterium]